MKRTDLGVILLTSLIIISSISLTLVGESRPDVYLSMAILIHFVYTSIDYSLRMRSSLKVIDIALFTVFIVIVTIRVLMILNII